jgi:hypothetical protein
MKVTMRPFAIGDVVVSVKDVEMSNRATVVAYEENERGYVVVTFADGVPRAMQVQSLQRSADRKSESRRPIGRGDIWALSANLGDYLTRMAEADSISKKEQQNEEDRSRQSATQS